MKLTKEETPENMWDIVKAQEKKIWEFIYS